LTKKTRSSRSSLSLASTVYFTIETDDDVPTVEGGPLTGLYQFNQLHYHWGDNDSYGSEGEEHFHYQHSPSAEITRNFRLSEWKTFSNGASRGVFPTGVQKHETSDA
jgi:hypothetical protein